MTTIAMAGSTAVTLSGVAPAAAPGQDSQAGKVGESASATGVDMSKLRSGGAGQAQAAQGSEDSSESTQIKQLREQLKQLQKQLAEEQKQLAQLMSKGTDDSGRQAAISAKQASIATLNGEILSGTAALLEALTESGSSSAGSMISTQA